MGKIYDSIGINQREIEQSSKQIRKLENELKKNISQAKVIVPFTMYGGFKDFSEIGELGTLNKIDDQAAYQRVFTGMSSVVAIWDNSVKLVNKPVATDESWVVDGTWQYLDASETTVEGNAVHFVGIMTGTHDRFITFDVSQFLANDYATTPADIPDNATIFFNFGGKLYKNDGVTRLTWGEIKNDISNNLFRVSPVGDGLLHEKYIYHETIAFSERELTKEFSLGDYMVGISFSTNLSSNVDNFSNGTDFTEMHDTESITVVVPAQTFSEKDMYKVYVIPQETQRWLRITDINRIKDTEGNVVFAEITFTSFNDIIENTGLSNYNYVQKAAIGENYAWPKIDGDVIDFEVKGGEGVNEYQIEFLGNTLIHGVGFIGRDADPIKIGEPKWLLTSDMLSPIESRVKRISAPENNLILLRDCKFTEKTYFKNWKDEMSQGYDLTIRKQYEGVVAFDDKLTQLNKDSSDKNIWDNSINFDLSGGPVSYDGSASPYVRAKYSVNQETVPGLLNRNVLSYSWMTQLPQEIDETIAWRSADIPVVGKLLNLFSLGVPWGWKHSTTLMKTEGLQMLGSRAQALMYSTAIFKVITEGSGESAKATGLIPAEAFDNTQENPIGRMTASKSVSIVMRGKLTDTITTGGVDFNTASMKKSTNTYKGDTVPKTVNGKYWFIDKHVINSVGKCDYIVTYFRDGVRVWSSRYQTTSKWTDNIRDWLNFVSYSPWVEFEADQNGINWNHIEDLPVPGGQSAYTTKSFYSSDSTTTIRTPYGRGERTKYNHKVTWQISKVQWDRYSHIVVPGLSNAQFITKDDFKLLAGTDVHNFAPTSTHYPHVYLTYNDKDPNFITISILYQANTDKAYAMQEWEYRDFVEALGDQLRDLTLYNV